MIFPANRMKSVRSAAHPVAPPLSHVIGQYDTKEVIRETVALLLRRRGTFGSPLNLLQEEYSQQVAKMALHDIGGATAPVSSPRGAESKTTWSQRPVEDVHQQYVEVHTRYTKLAAENLVKDERILALRERIAELQSVVRQLQQTVTQHAAHQVAPQDRLVGNDDSEGDGNPDVTVESDAEARRQLVALNLKLSERCEILEHNLSLGLLSCGREVANDMIELQKESERLGGICTRLASATLEYMQSNEALTKQYRDVAEQLATSERRRDQLEREMVALRFALERSKVT